MFWQVTMRYEERHIMPTRYLFVDYWGVSLYLTVM